MTLEALRETVGDTSFFRILKAWTTSNAGQGVTTTDFIRLAERVSRQDLDAFFAAWLGVGKPTAPTVAAAGVAGLSATSSVVPPTGAVRSYLKHHG